ncbi:MAG: HIT family protein [Bacilli bacterium]
MKDCLFCKIINNEIPCYKVYENNDILAFLDINPESYGHTLVIPKKHFNNYEDIDLDTIKKVNEVGKNIYNKIKTNLNADGIRLVQNNGIIQDVKHYHLHLVPIYKSDKEGKDNFEEVLKKVTK